MGLSDGTAWEKEFGWDDDQKPKQFNQILNKEHYDYWVKKLNGKNPKGPLKDAMIEYQLMKGIIDDD